MPWMVGNVLKNLFSRPATRPYPAEKREPWAGSRGSLFFDGTRCVFCGECERVCPVGAIRLETAWDEGDEAVWDDDEDGAGLIWLRVYDPFRCIFCGLCVAACAYGAVVQEAGHGPPLTGKVTEQGRVEAW